LLGLKRFTAKIQYGQGDCPYWASQVGKTTLVHALLKDIPFCLDGDDSVVAQTLAKANTETLKV
jgi:hypothetical protein